VGGKELRERKNVTHFPLLLKHVKTPTGGKKGVKKEKTTFRNKEKKT